MTSDRVGRERDAGTALSGRFSRRSSYFWGYRWRHANQKAGLTEWWPPARFGFAGADMTALSHMRDEGRIIVNPDTEQKGEEGLAKVFAIVFVVVMTIGIADHALTVAWKWILSSWDWTLAQSLF